MGNVFDITCESAHLPGPWSSVVGRGPIDNIDFPLLHRQKVALYAILTRLTDAGERDAVEGILALLDALQDDCALRLGEDAVFGCDGLAGSGRPLCGASSRSTG
jgi:hypothetical protein